MTASPSTGVARLTSFAGTDLEDLCEATEGAIREGGGFGWLKAPPRHLLEAYWKGVVLVPERHLFVGRLDGVVAGSAQLWRAPRNNEAQALVGHLTTCFVAPWARRYGLGRQLVLAVEEQARGLGLEILNLDVRETQQAAMKLYESLGFECWGTHPAYARVAGKTVPGRYYFKRLDKRT